MKKIYLLHLLLFLFLSSKAQNEICNRYYVFENWAKNKSIYLKNFKDLTVLQAGWTVIEEINGKKYQYVLPENDTIISYKYAEAKIPGTWLIDEIKHTNEAPDKLFFNPYHFEDENQSINNATGYIKIKENGYITILRSFWKFNAITIPFIIHPALNDSIGTRVTTDLKLGASFSYNLNLEVFKNRRFYAGKAVYGVSPGVGVGFSKISLNSVSTSLLDTPYKTTEDGLGLFIAPSVGLNLKGFQIIVSHGWDIPITSNVKDWNYSKKMFWGIGIGVGLEVFGKL